jgi:hypothetical protein
MTDRNRADPAPASQAGRPDVSVVIVSDYAGGERKSWDDLQLTLGALARQDFAGRAEFLLVESTRAAVSMPPSLTGLLPGLQVVLVDTDASYALKNAGVSRASAEIVGIVDADCTPHPGWVSALVRAFERHPEAAAISGRTTYPGRTLLERVLGLLNRSFLDPGRAAPTRFIGNNNAGYRRAAFLAHPLPTDAGPFASRMQSEAIARSGWRLFFEPAMLVIHDFEGWSMERDIRRNIGYSTIDTRLRDPSLPYAGLTRLGALSIPIFAVGKTLDNWRDVIRCGRYYGVRGYELGVAFVMAIVVHAMEVPAMFRAFRRRPLGRTAYR